MRAFRCTQGQRLDSYALLLNQACIYTNHAGRPGATAPVQANIKPSWPCNIVTLLCTHLHVCHLWLEIT